MGGSILVLADRSCALCGSLLPQNSNISICGECIKVADCCNGLKDSQKVISMKRVLFTISEVERVIIPLTVPFSLTRTHVKPY